MPKPEPRQRETGKTGAGLTPPHGNRFDLDEIAVVQPGNRDHRAGRLRIAEDLGIDPIEGWPVVDADKKHRDFHNVLRPGPRRLAATASTLVRVWRVCASKDASFRCVPSAAIGSCLGNENEIAERNAGAVMPAGPGDRIRLEPLDRRSHAPCPATNPAERGHIGVATRDDDADAPASDFETCRSGPRRPRARLSVSTTIFIRSARNRMVSINSSSLTVTIIGHVATDQREGDRPPAPWSVRRQPASSEPGW